MEHTGAESGVPVPSRAGDSVLDSLVAAGLGSSENLQNTHASYLACGMDVTGSTCICIVLMNK
jgi:hypothetical protein